MRAAPPQLEDIENELRAIRKLCIDVNHPNIVPVLDCGRFHRTIYYFIDMEICAFSLSSHIKNTLSISDAMEKFVEADLRKDIRDRLHIAYEISEGLKYVHQYKEVHRDLKPANGVTFASEILIPKFYIIQSPDTGNCPISVSLLLARRKGQ